MTKNSASSVLTRDPNGALMYIDLTLRYTRTLPALPSVLSQLLASSVPFSASVQAGTVHFIR